MKLENLNQEFPKMPETMRLMVEREVEKQTKTANIEKEKDTSHMRVWSMKKSVIAALVATMALGTTVFAGVKLYQMKLEPEGSYGMQTIVEKNTENTVAAEDIPLVKLDVSYLPEGMVETETNKYSYEDSLGEGGISLALYQMDLGDEAFEIKNSFITESEELTVNEWDAVYLKMQDVLENKGGFGQRIYVAYTDVHYVLEMYIGNDVTKEEALKIAQGVTLTPVETQDEATAAYSWSTYLASAEEDANQQNDGMMTSVSADKFEKNLHNIGESFSAGTAETQLQEGLEIKVSDVQILDGITGLDNFIANMSEEKAEELKKGCDAQGKLLPNTINYVKKGDGIDSLDEVVDTQNVAQKMVYITTEYSNTGNTELTDVLFMANLLEVQKTEDGYTVSAEGASAASTDGWDEAVSDSKLQIKEMSYYDVYSGERQNNYIPSIKPGETVTVHMAFIINEGEEETLFLNMDTFGGIGEFTEQALEMGYVDIRK